MRVKELTIKDRKLIEKVYKNEIETFGVLGGADMWMIMSFIRYGKLYVLVDEKEELLCVAQYQGILGKNEVFLYGFSTPLNKRRNGYANRLLNEVHKKLLVLGIKKIYLTVDPNNKIAIQLYEKLGYKIISLEKNEYGKGIDRYIMLKII